MQDILEYHVYHDVMIWHIDEQYNLEFSKVRFSEIENNNKDFVKNIQPVCLPSDTGDLQGN